MWIHNMYKYTNMYVTWHGPPDMHPFSKELISEACEISSLAIHWADPKGRCRPNVVLIRSFRLLGRATFSYMMSCKSTTSMSELRAGSDSMTISTIESIMRRCKSSFIRAQATRTRRQVFPTWFIFWEGEVEQNPTICAKIGKSSEAKRDVIATYAILKS